MAPTLSHQTSLSILRPRTSSVPLPFAPSPFSPSVSYGAQGVWVGTRFVAAKESAAPKRHKEGLTAAAATDTVRTLIYSGRPVRTLLTDYVRSWEDHRQVSEGWYETL